MAKKRKRSRGFRPEFEALIAKALEEHDLTQDTIDQLFPEPTPEEKEEIDRQLGPDFARKVRERAAQTEPRPDAD